ncbi:conserved hypothetical protein [metagenome]|uniref:Uncharacterized protein n=1 Tax=metagenome TaxID=256318 RepID=A0A2P2BZC2_9ZZZZ
MDPRLRAAVDESVSWYDDLFALHGLGCRISDGLWIGLGPPPPLHSAAKTVEPGVDPARAVAAVSTYEHCSVADSFGDLHLAGEWDLLFEARWLHHPGLDRPVSLPSGWRRIDSREQLSAWTARHGTSDVLLPGLLERSGFAFAGRWVDGALVADAVTHLGTGVVSLSNVWAADAVEDWPELVRVVAALWPGRAIVGYEHGESLEEALEAGFRAVGPQLVWAR